MVGEKGLPGHVADPIGEFLELWGQPLGLLGKLSEPQVGACSTCRRCSADQWRRMGGCAAAMIGENLTLLGLRKVLPPALRTNLAPCPPRPWVPQTHGSDRALPCFCELP